MTQIDPYNALRRKIVLVMAVAATIPLIVLSVLNFMEFNATFLREAQTPLKSMVAKTKNSFEMYFAERSSTVNLIASLYPFERIAEPATIQRIFAAMQREFSGFVDLGLVNSEGKLVAYAGPHRELIGLDYSSMDWLYKARTRQRYITDVFKGYRHIPHVVLAVQHTKDDGQAWVVRATLDTSQLQNIISAMNLAQGCDAFLLNRAGILQTDSSLYGNTLEKLPFPMPNPGYEASVVFGEDNTGLPVLISLAPIADTDFILMAVVPTSTVLSHWVSLRADMVFIFCVSVLGIYLVAARIVGRLIERLRQSDAEREAALLQVEHAEKLSSIGRLAAGVSHEINNPLAIINEKAGLLNDFLQMEESFARKDQFAKQLAAITAAVERCRDITQRMLGFARRMDAKVEELNVNEMIDETLVFLEQEARHRRVTVVRHFQENLPFVRCDRGQLQQVFLNVLNNALFAVDAGGEIAITSEIRDNAFVTVTFQDNGCGMSEETVKHIFEPFFTTKKEEGTGLGMSIIYGIVKRHGGDIEVTSTLDEGTAITIVLPAKQP